MASKMVECRVTGPLSLADVARVLQKAREAFPTFVDRLPQDVSFSAPWGAEGLPALADVQGITVERALDLSFTLQPDRVSAPVLAAVARDLQAACDERDEWKLACNVRLPADASSARPLKDGILRLWGGSGQGLQMSFSPYAFPLSPQSFIVLVSRPNPKRVLASYWAEERRRALGHFTTWAQSARLPLRFVQSEEQLSVERIDGEPVKAEGDATLGGPPEVSCPLRGVEAYDLGERLHAAVVALHARGTPGYAGYVYAPLLREQRRSCQELYAGLRSAAWPVASGQLHVRLRVQSLAGLETLRQFRHRARQGLCVLLAEFQRTSPGRRPHLVRLMDRARQDGHHLSLRLPSTHAAELPQIGTRLGVSLRP